MNKILEYLKSHSITTHTIAVVGSGLVTAFYQVPAFHDLVMSVYNQFPAGVKELATTAVALVAFYKARETK